jgi:hypothetical protein
MGNGKERKWNEMKEQMKWNEELSITKVELKKSPKCENVLVLELELELELENKVSLNKNKNKNKVSLKNKYPLASLKRIIIINTNSLRFAQNKQYHLNAYEKWQGGNLPKSLKITMSRPTESVISLSISISNSNSNIHRSLDKVKSKK